MKSNRNDKVSFAVARVRAAGLRLRWSSFGRWAAVATALVLLSAGVSFASFSLTFQGLARTLTIGGSITISAPAGTVVDPAGDIFLVDTGNNRIVEVNAQGAAAVLTISGLSPSMSSPSAIAIDGSGNLYVADTGNSRIVKITPSGIGTAVNTGSLTLSSPRGVVVDQSGNIFIADTGNNRIVEVPSGGTAAALTITVSTGASTMSSPKGLGVNTAGKLYIADSGNNRIVTVASGSTVGVVASITGGVTLSNPSAVAVDRIGNVYIADTSNESHRGDRHIEQRNGAVHRFNDAERAFGHCPSIHWARFTSRTLRTNRDHRRRSAGEWRFDVERSDLFVEPVGGAVWARATWFVHRGFVDDGIYDWVGWTGRRKNSDARHADSGFRIGFRHDLQQFDGSQHELLRAG